MHIYSNNPCPGGIKFTDKENFGGIVMAITNIYRDIAERTGGDIYIGVVGPVRTGKSTFIKKFCELMVIPNAPHDFSRERMIDELPQSAAGRTIMTTEPKFVPERGVRISVDENIEMTKKKEVRNFISTLKNLVKTNAHAIKLVKFERF